MKRPAFLAGFIRQVSSLRRDEGGVSAIEFAMVLPLMVTLYVGVIEISKGVAIDRKVTLTTRTLADLASQYRSIDNATMQDVLDASAAVIYPYDASKLTGTVSAVNIDANGVAKVAWSDSLNGGKTRAVDSTVTPPTALNVPNTQLIWSEVNYSYTPDLGAGLVGPLNLFDEIYMRPRLSEAIARPNS